MYLYKLTMHHVHKKYVAGLFIFTSNRQSTVLLKHWGKT